MKHITRKSLLYKTEVEYSDYTANHVQGCSHGCKYPCYAMMMAKRFGLVKSYEDWCEPKLVTNALDLLEKEIPKLKSKISYVHLCFSTDPFMYRQPEICDMSVAMIRLLNIHRVKAVALTKGILPAELATTDKKNEFGISIVSLDEKFRAEYEPGSAPYEERIASLKKLHKSGFKTWVSIEPYPTPNIVEQELCDILDAVSFCDKIVFGRLNYNATVTAYPRHKEFYNGLARKVLAFCDKHGKEYHIKTGTLTTEPRTVRPMEAVPCRAL